MRRREDRELVDDVSKLKRNIRRQKDGKRQQRHAIRGQCKAILHEGCTDINEIEDSNESFSVRLLDLSDGGAAVFMDFEEEVGAQYCIELHMDEGQIIRTPAEVSWTRNIKKHDGFATGFQFNHMPPDEEKTLTSVLAYIQQTLGL